MKRSGAVSLMPLLAITGLVGLGVAGYKLTSDCGGCKVTEAVVTTISDECPLGGCCEGEAVEVIAAAVTTEPGGCCSAEAEVVLAADQQSGCCQADGEAVAVNASLVAEGECKDGQDGCTGDGKDGCCGGCEGEAETTTASNGG